MLKGPFALLSNTLTVFYMRKNWYLTIVLLLSSLHVNAQLGADGYYRIQNTVTTRYVQMIDNKGEVDLNTTSVDLGALRTVMYFDNVAYDPATIIYISHIQKDEYNISCQGMNMVDMIGFGLRFQKLSSGHYVAFQEQQGLRKVLNDLRGTSLYGAVLTNDASCKEWDLLPVNDNNYFGIKPDFEINGKYYKSFFAAFPFDLKSEGMKAWYVKQVDTTYGICVVEQIDGTVPAATPVLIECSSNLPEKNRLDIKMPSSDKLAGNLLQGVYFDNSNKKHYNRVAYTKSNMRLLGVTADGTLGFVTDQTLDFMPMNSCYLKADGAPEELAIMQEDEYEEYLKNAETPDDPGNDDPNPGQKDDPEDTSVALPVSSDEVEYIIYSIDGRRVNCSVDELPAGIWIVNGRKFIVRD